VTAVSGADFRSGRFNSFVRVSGEQMRSAGELRGPLPIAPDRAHLQFSERQTAFVPRTTSANTRFFTHEQPSAAARVPFTAQQRAFEPGARTEAPAATALGTREAAPANRGWTRFGAPGAAVESPQARQGFQSQPAPGGSAPAQTRNESQNRPTFQGGTYTPPARPEYQSQPENRTPQSSSGGSRFGQPGRTESPRMSAPVVNDRPSGGGSSAPRSSGGSGGGGSRGKSGGNGNHGGGHNR